MRWRCISERKRALCSGSCLAARFHLLSVCCGRVRALEEVTSAAQVGAASMPPHPCDLLVAAHSPHPRLHLCFFAASSPAALPWQTEERISELCCCSRPASCRKQRCASISHRSSLQQQQPHSPLSLLLRPSSCHHHASESIFPFPLAPLSYCQSAIARLSSLVGCGCVDAQFGQLAAAADRRAADRSDRWIYRPSSLPHLRLSISPLCPSSASHRRQPKLTLADCQLRVRTRSLHSHACQQQ